MAAKTLEELVLFVKKFWSQQDAENPAMRDKAHHVRRVVKLAEEQGDELLVACAWYHDIGRVPQLQLLGGFKDGVVLHHHLGTNLFEQWLYKGLIESTIETDVIREVIAYHGRARFLKANDAADTAIAKYVSMVSVIDDIDNGCVGAIGYLDREADDDAKDYIKNDPSVDQKSVSPEVLDFYIKGEKFDKLKYCKTYADYVLFAIVLAINSLKGEYSATAVKAMSMSCVDSYGIKYVSALEGYEAVLFRRLNQADAEFCYEVLEGFYNKAK